MNRVTRFLSVSLMTALLLVVACVLPLDAQVPPRPDRLVNDYAGVLTDAQREGMERMLVAFDDSTSNQIAVLFVDDLGGYDIASYAVEVGEQWQVGRKEYDNGIVVVVKPKRGNARGEVFISVGYGLEGAVPDAVANRIVDRVMIPRFAAGDYYGGVNDALVLLMRLASGEISASSLSSDDDDLGGVIAVGFLLLFVFILVMLVRRSGGGGTDTFSGSGHSHRSGPIIFTGGFGGGSFGGGFGGGGFGGFGGGSFGGGGAGGSW